MIAREPANLSIVAVALSCISLLLCSGCAPRLESTGMSDYEHNLQTKVSAEAYLFDARIWRNNKPTSFRLELFQTDSVIGLAGRGYVGKGVLKGRLTADSLICLFPVSNEYVESSFRELWSRWPCDLSSPELNLFDLFSHLPESLDIPPAIIITTINAKRDRRRYLIQAEGCNWSLELLYDHRKRGWRVRKFEYKSEQHSDNKDNFRLRATRREYQKTSRVKLRRFHVRIPPGALRISP